MSKKSIALLFLLIVAPLVIYMLWPSEEAQIRKLVRHEARAIEAEDLKEVMSKVSFSYQDQYGLSYLTIQKIMERQFQRYSDIEVDYKNLRIDIAEGDKEANVSMELSVMAKSGEDMGYLVGGDGPVHFELRLKKGGALGTWQVVEASGFMEGAGGGL